MADSSSPSSNKTHIPSPPSVPTKPPKSKSLFTNYFFSKSLMIILVLLVFSYFPSQVPEIFKETTLIPKLWDLIYLLVIGIAVCYGLFSRKTDTVHRSDEDNIRGNEAYLSGISQISSIFEDGNHGIRNSYGFEEKSWVEGFKGSGSRSCEIGDGKKMNQCFIGESLVVINDEKYVLEQLGRQKTVRQNLGSKSLDSAAGKSVFEDSDSDSRKWFKESKNGNFRGMVPVKLEEKFQEKYVLEQLGRQKTVRQNVGSKSLDSAAGKSVFEDSDSDSRKWFKESKNGNFRGLVPVKLEEKFQETGSDSGSDSDSKSMRLEKRDDLFTGDTNESGVLDFGMPSKIKSLSEKEESKGVEGNRRYRKSYLNGETSFVESKLQESSTGGFSETNSRLSAKEVQKASNGTMDGSCEEIIKDFGKIKVDDGTFDSKNNKQFVRSKSQSSSIDASEETFKNMLGKEEKPDISNPIPKPPTIANAYKRGKSVRTNRSKEQVLESKVNTVQSQTDDDKVEARTKLGIDEMDIVADELSDPEPHSGEVDRKAEEFIAKFREQIRLQKVASARKLNLL